MTLHNQWTYRGYSGFHDSDLDVYEVTREVTRVGKLGKYQLAVVKQHSTGHSLASESTDDCLRIREGDRTWWIDEYSYEGYPKDEKAVKALIDASGRPEVVLERLGRSDAGFEYRQVVILAAGGTAAAHTGARCRRWAGHRVGAGFAVFGNVLAGPPVVDAMAAAARAAAGAPLGERLLQVLEAGRDAGGQQTETGEHLAERSAALMVKGEDIVEDLDLRVDVSACAIEDLRRAYEAYAPYLPYYALRARDPANTPAQDVWAREHLGHA